MIVMTNSIIIEEVLQKGGISVPDGRLKGIKERLWEESSITSHNVISIVENCMLERMSGILQVSEETLYRDEQFKMLRDEFNLGDDVTIMTLVSWVAHSLGYYKETIEGVGRVLEKTTKILNTYGESQITIKETQYDT